MSFVRYFVGLIFRSDIFFKTDFGRKRSLRDPDDLRSGLPFAIGGKRQLLKVFFRIDADTLQRSFKLLQAVGQHLLFHYHRGFGVLERAIVDGDHLLNFGGNNAPCRGAQGHGPSGGGVTAVNNNVNKRLI